MNSKVSKKINTLWIAPIFFYLCILGILFLFGFTHVITQPSLFGRILFFLTLIPSLFLIGLATLIFKLIRTINSKIQLTVRSESKSNITNTPSDEPTIRDIEYTTTT